MTNRLGNADKFEVDNLISNLYQEKLLSENEVKFICDKVNKNKLNKINKRQKNYLLKKIMSNK